MLQADRGWLIKFDGTTVELSAHIGITKKDVMPQTVPAIVMLISSYYGRGPTEMWEWLKTRFEQ